MEDIGNEWDWGACYEIPKESMMMMIKDCHGHGVYSQQ